MISSDLYACIRSVMPIVCVDCLLVVDSNVLLLKRSNSPAYGQWWFPGGRILHGEDITTASLRKLKEETSLEANFKNILSVETSIFPDENIHTINICCILDALEPKHELDIAIDSLHADWCWIDADTLESAGRLHEAVYNPLRQLLIG